MFALLPTEKICVSHHQTFVLGINKRPELCSWYLWCVCLYSRENATDACVIFLLLLSTHIQVLVSGLCVSINVFKHPPLMAHTVQCCCCRINWQTDKIAAFCTKAQRDFPKQEPRESVEIITALLARDLEKYSALSLWFGSVLVVIEK